MSASGRLDVKRLRIFREAARGGSFAQAGLVLAFSPSAISQQMSALERDLGVVLFQRTARGVKLTHAGRKLLAHTESVLERVAEAEVDLESIAGLRSGHLRFGSFTSASTVFAAAAVESFRRRYPGIAVSVFDGEPYESIARLFAGELDLALVFDLDHWQAARNYDGVVAAPENGLELLPLFDDPFFLLVPQDHRLAARTGATLQDLGDETVLGSPPCRRARRSRQGPEQVGQGDAARPRGCPARSGWGDDRSLLRSGRLRGSRQAPWPTFCISPPSMK